jgi:hypothetical protein
MKSSMGCRESSCPLPVIALCWCCRSLSVPLCTHRVAHQLANRSTGGEGGAVLAVGAVQCDTDTDAEP